MKPISFWKMEGCGNDFMVLDSIKETLDFSAADIQRWAHRRKGVGFDQLLLLEPPEDAGIDFNYRIFNADGSEVGQCGNGARCVTVYAVEQGLTDKKTLHLKTKESVLTTELLEGRRVRVQLAPPQFEPGAIPFITEETQPPYGAEGEHHNFDVVNMGNPHGVIWMEHWEDVSDETVSTIGKGLQSRRALFPEGVNVGVAHRVNNGQIRLRVYERGAGETLACGSGACAAAVIGIKNGQLDQKVDVILLGGTVTVTWEGGDAPVLLEGPVASVFRGKILL